MGTISQVLSVLLQVCVDCWNCKPPRSSSCGGFNFLPPESTYLCRHGWLVGNTDTVNYPQSEQCSIHNCPDFPRTGILSMSKILCLEGNATTITSQWELVSGADKALCEKRIFQSMRATIFINTGRQVHGKIGRLAESGSKCFKSHEHKRTHQTHCEKLRRFDIDSRIE